MAYLSDPKETIAVLQRYNFNFQKKFGQNFLIDGHVIEKIIAAAGIGKEDVVLEIGPGIGTLTQRLCEAAGDVVAVEIDRKEAGQGGGQSAVLHHDADPDEAFGGPPAD